MNKGMSRFAGSGFAGKKLSVLVLGLVLVAAACNKTTPAADNSGQTPTPEPPVSQSPTPTPAPTPNPTPTPVPTPATVEIKMTASGFEPANVTIKKGDTVKFINNDTRQHWPASNPHPSHTDLPGFDSLKGIATGSSYSYTFTKTGTWGYHDHLVSTRGGKVTVQ